MVEILEYWQKLKVHSISLEIYLDKRNMKLPKWKVESSTSIQLKSLSCWLINENRLSGQQNTRKRGSTIVITIQGEAKAKTLCASGFWFGGIVRILEKYWEAGPDLVLIIYCSIRHHQMRSYGD